MAKTSSKIVAAKDINDVQTWQIPPMDQPVPLTIEQYSEGLGAVCGQLPTLQDIELLKKAAADEGYQAGYAEGKQNAEKDVAQVLQCAHNIIQSLVEPAKLLDQDVKQQLAQLAIAVAKHIIKAELKRDVDHISQLVEQALTILPESPAKIYIHLNPEDAAAVKNHLPGDSGQQQWMIIEDGAIDASGCKVFTDSSSIDMSLDTQLARIAAKLLDIDDEETDPDFDRLTSQE